MTPLDQETVETVDMFPPTTRVLRPEAGLKGRLVLPGLRKAKAWRYNGADLLPSDGGSDGMFQPALRQMAVKVSRFRVAWRLARLLAVALYFGATLLWRRLTIMDRGKRQTLNALSFQKALLTLGGVFIKAGQQLSQRADILPLPYCDALKDLLDDVKERIPRTAVFAALKRQTGRPPHEVFAEFNYDAIASASVACVYRAVLLLRNQEVAVKIRRPGIQKKFTADLTALDWILKTVEFLTILRPGMSANLRYELRDQLLEELDFRMEARYQELFRRYMKRRKKLNVTAPKVYYNLSGEEVLVTEFVTGFWVKEIIDKIHACDEEYLAQLDSFGIDPRIVAKRLIRSAHYSFYECPMFHGDPHSANILIQPNNRIVMVDFGACGVFSHRVRALMWHMNQLYSTENVAGMVNTIIRIMEPLPHVDIEPFRRQLLEAWWKGFYGVKSNHAKRWERTSVRLWLAFYELMRVHKIPVPPKMLRMLRATLLYDTVAAELYSKINVFKEFEKYSDDYARRIRHEMEESAVRQLLLGPDNSAFLKLHQIAHVGNELLFRVEKFLSDPDFNFSAVASKIYSAVRAFVRMALICGGATVVTVLGLMLYHAVSDNEALNVIEHPRSSWLNLQGLKSPLVIAWLISLAVIVFSYARRVYIEFGDIDE